MSDFITEEGKWTLEEIAIEVGLRKLGYKYVRGDVPFKDVDHLFDDNGACIAKDRSSIIAAAFPFKVRSNRSDGATAEITSIKDMDYFIKAYDGVLWQLMDAKIKEIVRKGLTEEVPIEEIKMLAKEVQKIVKQGPTFKVPIEPECKCNEKDYLTYGHREGCPMIGYYSGK